MKIIRNYGGKSYWNRRQCAAKSRTPTESLGLSGSGNSRQSQVFHSLTSTDLSHPSREARRIVFDFQGFRITPLTPLRKGWKGSLARDVIPSAQQKYTETVP